MSAFDAVLGHLRAKGPVCVPSPAGDLLVRADGCVSQIYVHDTDLVFWFAFYPWFSGLRAYARRRVRHGDLETPTLELSLPATPSTLVTKIVGASSDYILKVRRGS